MFSFCLTPLCFFLWASSILLLSSLVISRASVLALIMLPLDLREDTQFFLDHPGAGEELKKSIGAAAYIECSEKCSRKLQNVKAVSDATIRVVLQPPRKPALFCDFSRRVAM
uniref:Uncharacterized protein n=1 Tax=Solanum lycopersicum TaxID=4081 RepID=A0A3Q7IHM4_SOLLC